MYRILYVDDESFLLEIGKLFLEETGDFTVSTALGPPEALLLLEQEKFDAIISDYQMPGMDGIQFLVVVRARFGSIPFVLFTGRGREEVVIQAINSGVDFYLQKGGDPVAQFAELSHKIRIAIERYIAVKALQESEARSRALIENTSDIIRILDCEGRIIFDSAASERLLGYPPGYTIGRSPMEFIHPDDLGIVKRELSEVYNNTNSGIPTEFRLRKADGSYAYVESTAKNLIGVSGINGIVIATRFIDEQKLADKALLESRRQLDAMATNIPGVVYRFYVNPDGTTGFDYISERSRQILGLENDPATFFNRLSKGFDTQNRERFLDSVQHVINTKKLWKFESQYIKPSGEKIWVSAVSSPVMENDRLIFDGVIFDKTDQKEADEFIRLLAQISDDAPASVTVHDFEGNFLYANEETFRLHGYSREEFMAKKVREVDVPESAELIAERMQQVRDSGAAGFDVEHFRKDGSAFPLHVNVKIVDWGKKNVLLSIATDISERKKAEEVLLKNAEQLSAANEQLTATDEELKAQYDALAKSDRKIRESEERVRLKLESLLTPDGDIETLGLGDIFDPQKLQSLLDDFTRLTGMATAILDTKGNVLVATGWQQICTRFHRVNAETAKFCAESDLHLAKTIKQGEYIAYKCRNNLWDVVTPLYIGSEHMGNIFIGQFFYDDEIIDESVFSKQAEKYGFNQDEYLAAFHQVPRYSREKVHELMDYLVKLTGFISRLSYSNLKLARTVTERDTLLNSLQKSEGKFRTLVENIPQKIFLKDLNSRYLMINEKFAHDLGIDPGEITGKKDTDFFPPELAARYHADDIRVMKTGQTEEFEERYIQDGRETLVHMIKTVVRDKDGEIIGLLGVFWDITERWRAEKALRESEEFNRALVENLPDYIVVYGPDGKIHYANPPCEQLLGYEAGMLVGQPMLQFVAEEYRKKVISSIAGRRKGDEILPYVIDILTQDGTRRSAIVKGTPIRYHDTPAILVLLIDITERKRAEEALHLANKKLALLAGITRHDINNQITVLQSYLAILEKKQGDPSFKEYLLKARTAAQRISSMIQFTKEYETVGVKAPLWQSCRTIVDTALKEAHPGQVTRKNDLPAGLEVFADPLIVKVFYNLMENAMQYGGKITIIRFSVEERDRDRIIVCEDDGVGVPASEKKKIFERGFGKNTGLGLALSQEILAITGITISETGEPGKGARFEMVVPEGAWRNAGRGNT